MPKTRSTNYPAIHLAKALELAGKLYTKAQRHWMPATAVVLDAWGMSPTSSLGKQCIGALRAFGLADAEGTGELRKIRLTERAAKILENHPSRPTLLAQAALEPKVYRTVWERCAADGALPPDPTLFNFLLFEHDPPFNKASIAGFIKDLRATMSFAGVGASGIMPNSGEPQEEEPEDSGESKGDSAGEISPAPKSSRARAASERRPGMNEDVFTLTSGDIVLQWPANLTKDEYEDFKGWLKIMERKVGRAVREQELPKDDPEAA